MKRVKLTLSERDMERANKMRRGGLSYRHIAVRLGVNYSTMLRALNPQYYDRVRDRAREYAKQNYRVGKMHPADPSSRLQLSGPLIDERERRNEASQRQDLTGATFGDPPPGYSALDEKKRGQLP